MTALQDWLTPNATRTVALAILHFLWQGVALAALASAAMVLFRSAATRYAIAVVFLALMVAAPGLTFMVLQRQWQAGDVRERIPVFQTQTRQASGTEISLLSVAVRRAPYPSSSDSLPWLVETWLLGVVLLSLRPAAGFVVLARMRRYQANALAEHLQARCLALQHRLGIDRLIQYCECLDLQTPAVVGWFRPILFVPLSAITGLSADQLDAVIAHELAHVKRHDAFVNLFEIAAETLLFYHPAIWWLSKRIRAERENCCDDVAVAVCANAADYARALASMAEWQTAPALVMAANRSPLAARVARILGAAKLHAGVRGASLAASVLCLSASLVAGHALFGSHHAGAAAQSIATVSSAVPALQPSPSIDDAAIIVTAPSPAAPPAPARQHVPMLPDADSSADNAGQDNSAQEKSPAALAEKISYIEALKSAGLANLSVDQLIALKIQGVTSEYVRELHALIMHLDVDAIVAMKIQGITPAYLKELREAGLTGDPDDAIALKVQGVTPDYVRELRANFPAISFDEILAMKIQGITPGYVRELQELTALKLDADELIAMKVQGVSPAYIRDLKALNLKIGADEIIAMKVQGVTPDYVKSLQSAGLRFDADELIGAKVQGITADFIARVRKLGFKDLDLDKLMQLKHSGVLDQ